MPGSSPASNPSSAAGRESRDAGCPKKLSLRGDEADCSTVVTAARQASSSGGWRATLTWAGAVLCWYAALQLLVLPRFLTTDPAAEALMLSQVPIRFYLFSEAAFFTAAVLNVLSFIFEETQEKRQLAFLAALIKGLSWHCDYLIVTGQAIITFDAYGALLMPSRYVQWSCTTPTMLFTLSKISDFSNQQVAVVMISDWLMIVTGYIAAVFPSGPVSCLALAVSFGSFYHVLYNLYLMIRSALTEANSPHARASLYFTLWSSLVIWHLFPVAWCISRLAPSVSYIAEPLALIANFSAKVVFSSCILYNNYVTLQQRRLVAQLEQEHRDRIRLVEELKTAVQSKDDFISVIGHELRTPLNAVIQLSAAIMSNFGAPGTWQKHYTWMETIARSAKHLLGIINDIITIKAARSGMHMKQELVHIGHVVDHVIRTLSPMAKRGVVIEKAVIKHLPLIVADERRIIQLLSNLLGNALKFTDKGKVSVTVRVDRGARNIIIKVQDTGCGIPKKELKNLLVPFKQADMSSSRKYGGTGLGLSIANQLVQAHSGTVELLSDEGAGTAAVVKLPVLQPETHALLEGPFKAAYVSAGYSYEELMSNEVAKMENRRVPAFRSSSAQALRISSSRASPRSSVDSNAPSLHVEQFSWDDYYNNDLGPESAAASTQGGPPPLAVALVSSLYSSSAPPVVPAQRPTPTVLNKLSTEDSGSGLSSSYAWAHSPSALHPASAPQPQPQFQSSSRRSAPLPAFPAGGAAREYPVSQSTPSSGSFAVQEGGGGGGGGGVARVDSTAAPLSAGLLPLDEHSAQSELESDEYAGSWHRAPRFGDDYDDSHKEYYSYENRVSYEYRPSLDQEPADWGRRSGSGQGQVVKGAAKPLTAVFRRISMSLQHASSYRRRESVDAPRGGGGGRSSAAQDSGWRTSAGLDRGGDGVGHW